MARRRVGVEEGQQLSTTRRTRTMSPPRRGHHAPW
uniref:Uncharacterized protein n=1 Tax=Arundo donax TaxID=35708 RepID=A0A0A9FY03_ARUDO